VRKLRPFEYFRPRSLDEALDILCHYGASGRVMAGGTDLLVGLKHRKTPSPEAIVDLKGLRSSLDRFTWSVGGGFTIGALFTVAAVTRHPDIRAHLGMLRTAAFAIGHPQIRARATVVGNLCNGSPSADMAPSLLALDARVTIARVGGTRTIPLSAFYAGPFKTVLQPDEIVTELEVPPMPARTGGHYAWQSKANAVDETLVGAAAVVSLGDGGVIAEVRIGLGSMSPIPMRAFKAEALLRGQRVEPLLLREAAQTAAAETGPRRRAEYRQDTTVLLLQRSLHHAVQLAG
jgi:carbon-monoxide dehydrogenase medium subunit